MRRSAKESEEGVEKWSAMTPRAFRGSCIGWLAATGKPLRAKLSSNRFIICPPCQNSMYASGILYRVLRSASCPRAIVPRDTSLGLTKPQALRRAMLQIFNSLIWLKRSGAEAR
jgi:hypothetical protein